MALPQPEPTKIKCSSCDRQFTTFSDHELCHVHSPCCQGGHYKRANCEVCQDLFSTYKEGEHSGTELAILAAFKLREWYRSLAKNFRPSDDSDKFISCPSEREELRKMTRWVSPLVKHFPIFQHSASLPSNIGPLGSTRPMGPTPKLKGRELKSGTESRLHSQTLPNQPSEDLGPYPTTPSPWKSLPTLMVNSSPSFIPEPEDSLDPQDTGISSLLLSPTLEMEENRAKLNEKGAGDSDSYNANARLGQMESNIRSVQEAVQNCSSKIQNIESSLESKLSNLVELIKGQQEEEPLPSHPNPPSEDDEDSWIYESEEDMTEPPRSEKRESLCPPLDSSVPWKRYNPDTMEIGADGSMTIEGSHVSADKIEINYDEMWPRWRFKTSCPLIMEPTRPSRALLQPKKAFNDFGTYIMDNNPSVLQLQGSTFPPYNRGFLVKTENLLFTNPFFSIIAKSFSEFCLKERFEWEEFSLPFNIIPGDASNTYFIDSYADNLGSKKLTTSAVRDQLMSADFPKLSDSSIREDLEARQNWFTSVSLTLGLEAMAAVPNQNPGAAANLSLAKLSLMPLQIATRELFRARLALRREGLKGCERDNPWVQQLLFSHPLSVEPFTAEVVENVQEQSRRLGWAVPRVLGHRSSLARTGKRKVVWKNSNIQKRPHLESTRGGYHKGSWSKFRPRGRGRGSRRGWSQSTRGHHQGTPSPGAFQEKKKTEKNKQRPMTHAVTKPSV